jgi:hypothetical protein
MKCPKCGNPRLKYNVSRKKLWKKNNQGVSKSDPREEFTSKCSKCGYEGEVK